MQQALMIGFYIALALLLVVLALGLINLLRTDEKQRSRSNQLMRARIMVQGVIIGILVLLGVVMGSIKLF
ncbi:MAG: HIG1 domain-containing protein [Pseudomonadota bacterium]